MHTLQQRLGLHVRLLALLPILALALTACHK